MTEAIYHREVGSSVFVKRTMYEMKLQKWEVNIDALQCNVLFSLKELFTDMPVNMLDAQVVSLHA